MFCLLCEESQRSAWPARALPFSSPRWRIDWAVQHYRNTWISGGTNVYNWSLPLWLPAVALSFFLSFFFFAAAQHGHHRKRVQARTHSVCAGWAGLSRFVPLSPAHRHQLGVSPGAIHCTFLYDTTLTGEACAASSHRRRFTPNTPCDAFPHHCWLFPPPPPPYLALIAWWPFAAETAEDGSHQRETLLSLAVSHSCPLTVHLKLH